MSRHTGLSCSSQWGFLGMPGRPMLPKALPPPTLVLESSWKNELAKILMKITAEAETRWAKGGLTPMSGAFGMTAGRLSQKGTFPSPRGLRVCTWPL